VVWNSRRDSRKRLCFIHVTVENSLGFTLQDCNRVMEHTRFLLLTRSTSVEGSARGLKEKRERSQSVPLTLPASCSLFLHQQAAKHASPTTSRACSRRLREHTADEAPNKRAAHTPQQIVGVGAPSLLSILRPAALDVSPNWLTYLCTNSCARFCLSGETLHLRALLPSGIDITGS